MSDSRYPSKGQDVVVRYLASPGPTVREAPGKIVHVHDDPEAGDDPEKHLVDVEFAHPGPKRGEETTVKLERVPPTVSDHTDPTDAVRGKVPSWHVPPPERKKGKKASDHDDAGSGKAAKGSGSAKG